MGDDDLIRDLCARSASLSPPVASAVQIADTETRVGFYLPLLLRRIYAAVVNGGVGDGLLGIDGCREGESVG
ncbi:MAG: hypothetical protein WCJ30_01315 [Deltaproteobacteria bacterium]